MPDGGASYRVGNIGEGAFVQQGEYLFNVSVQVENAEDADGLLRRLRKELGERAYHGPLLRRLDPIVLVNRAEQLVDISRFLEQSDASVLYVVGLAGIGKSTLVRGALEFRRADTPAVWVNCQGLDAEQLLAELDAGLRLEAHAVLADTSARLMQKIDAVLGAIKLPSILVLDGFEALLDANGRYRSKDIAQVMDALVASEHKAKALVSTRRLPHRKGRGSAGVQILRLGGLSKTMAENLFQVRAQLTPEEMEATLPPEAFERLEGHPKFIELLASATAELPVDHIVSGLLTASDIGEFVVSEVLSQLEHVELQVLRAALVFRGVFTLDALSAVYGALNGGSKLTFTPVRTLVQRSVLDTSGEPQTAYYLHPILRDAVPREPGQEAPAHAAAGEWFLRREFDPASLASWDDGLYHLRRAAEVGQKETHFRPYMNFVFEHGRELSYSGWGRRLVSEYRALDALTQEDSDRLALHLRLGLELRDLGEESEAFAVFRGLDEWFCEPWRDAPPEEIPREVAKLLVLIKVKLGHALLEQGDIETAHRTADDIHPLAAVLDNLSLKLQHLDLRFAIAKETQDLEMLRYAAESFQLAEQLVQQSSRPSSLDVLAEAHFKLATSYLQLAGQAQQSPELDVRHVLAEMFKHFAAQLRIKLDIGKIGGVSAGLFNLGILGMTFSEIGLFDQVSAGAMLLTSEQITLEVGTVVADWWEEETQKIIQQFLSDHENIKVGREALAAISDKLLPYFQRALERRLGTSPA